jgi:predicted AlkP superfamily phosphohydrolase/phosphomutase
VSGGDKKILVISLDGATFDVLRPLMNQGYMPTLEKLTKVGLAADLESVIPPVTAPAWTSFMTGKTPGKHGIFDFTRFDPVDRTTKLNNSQHIRSKTLWQILSENGKRVIVVNLPYTYPPYQVNGAMVSGWDAPSTQVSFTFPETLRSEIFEKIPDYGSTLDLSLGKFLPTKSDAEFASFIGKLVRGFEQGSEVASLCMQRSDWDVCMVHFQQPDWIQHKLWNDIERACNNSEDKSSRVEMVRECYSKFDSIVAALLARVEPLDPVVIVLSDHGFGRLLGTIYPNLFLFRWGHFHFIDDANNWVRNIFRMSRFGAVRRLYSSVVRLKHFFFDRRQIRKLKSWGELANEKIPQQKSQIDWTRTKVAAVEGSETSHLYVNLKGRSPEGIVSSGPEYESLVSELITKFMDLRHPRTGEKLLAGAIRGKDAYPKSQDGVQLPDIILIPQAGYRFSPIVSDAPPTISNEGNHRHNGIIIIHGEGLNRTVENFRPNLIDVAPTVLHLLGLPVPPDMDGRVLGEIFLRPEDVRYEDADNPFPLQNPMEYGAEEAMIIEQRLKGLGYLE